MCVECGFSAQADRVGAINIKEAGLASLACSSSSQAASASCQEPTEGMVCASVQPVGIPSVHEGEDVNHFTSEFFISDFHWSPDGKTLAIIREHDVADVVLLREGNQ